MEDLFNQLDKPVDLYVTYTVIISSVRFWGFHLTRDERGKKKKKKKDGERISSSSSRDLN